MSNILIAAIVLALGYFVLQHVDFRQEGSQVSLTYHEQLSVPGSSPWASQQGTQREKR